MASKPKLVVLRRRSDFLSLQKSGRRIKPAPWLLLNFKENELGTVRLGWTIPGKAATSVVRNRIKRWCREFFRSFLAGYEGKGIDLNVVILGKEKDGLRRVQYDEFRRALESGSSRIFNPR